MKGKIVIITIASIVIYVLLIMVFYFAAPFMVSWGAEKPWYLKMIAFIQDFPFSLTRSNGEIVLSLIFVNALFWTLIIAVLLYLISSYRTNKNHNVNVK